MKKHKTKKWLSALFALPTMGIFPLTSCGLNRSWNFDEATKGATVINYCLLIGQNDHTDSIERTRYARKALGTLDESEETKIKTKDNPNVAKPIQGKFLKRPPNNGEEPEYFIVNEIEQMEQKSMAGATWDPITANDTAGTWLAKHGRNITMFVSNNDAMAEGAMWTSNWIKGMPIFGYDANATTIQRIKAGSITGTVDQNPSIQCSAAMMVIRNMLEDRDIYWKNNCVSSEECHWFGKETYDPTARGFAASEERPSVHPQYGWVDSAAISKNDLSVGSNREILSQSVGIAHLEGDMRFDNVDTYINQETGEAKQPVDMLDEFTHIKDAKPSTSYKVCHSYCNKSETYIVANMRPYFNEYAKRLSLNLDIVEGDGTDEAMIINQIDARPTGGSDFDAYLINMAKTTSTNSYVTNLAKRAYQKEEAMGIKRTASTQGWDKFEDRLDTPLIFWNRQPHAEDGSIDQEIMNNKYFKYTYFVGVDSVAGGKEQGEMIASHLRSWYEKWLEEHSA